eukprot:CAMPEP_0170493288 /NCGR_PEP_ID=MMETSP0208-20121228/13662_1 /TAXON_ID=197538 /ORGANISM="Strombidium inclinatum, Strain S3" /LENGTH=50 /DNA_ID=CAMNT_0010769193 /DNA_START=35 /DNA_END=187 /DNA_ORIENTATION=+
MPQPQFDPSRSANFQEAMSVLAITNRCFDKCVVEDQAFLVTPELREKLLT